MFNNLRKLFTKSTSTEMVKKSLKDFGYGFNEEGQLRKLNPDTGAVTDNPFEFVDQKHYEDLGDSITEYVYELLDGHGLHRISVPKNQSKSKATFIFATQKELKEVNKLMLIIHGSGVVRAGQWARSLIINHSLDAGTVLPYVKKAQAQGYEVIITNTNDNYRDGNRIVGSGSPEEHAKAVWETIVRPSNTKSIAIVAHSYGGVVVCSLEKKFKDDFEKKVFAAAFTDSVHGKEGSRLANIGINFVSSTKPLGAVERGFSNDGMLRVSAGHPKHEMTSFSCIEALFEFVEKKFVEERGGTENPESPENKKAKVDEL